MSLKWWWLALALVAVFGLAALARLRFKPKKPVRFVANSKTLGILPSFKKEQQRAQLLRTIEYAALGVLVATLIIIAGRPQQRIQKIEQEQSRDIVMCVDVSGSMKDYAASAFTTLQNIVNKNPTDRYSVVLFQNAPYVALPLTSDVSAINTIAKKFSDDFKDSEFTASDLLGFKSGDNDSGGTDIALGLASCMRRFDAIEEPRSRHIIMLSDMDHNSVSDQNAVAALLPKYGVKLYVLAPQRDVAFAQDSPVVQIAGASVGALDNDSDSSAALSSIFNSILSTRTSQAYVLADAPYGWWGIALIALITWWFSMVLRWRRHL